MVKSVDDIVEKLKDIFRLRYYPPTPENRPPRSLVIELALALGESTWLKANRPYYDVYPSVIEMLEKINLDFDLTDLKLPMGFAGLLLKFPSGNKLGVVGKSNIDSVFISTESLQNRRLLIFTYIRNDGTNVEKTSMEFSYNNGENGRNVISNLKDTVAESSTGITGVELACAFFKIYVSICLIGEDPELIERCVLSSDENKLNDSNRDKLVSKAIGRGKHGFKLGAGLEKIPHFRKAHMCWVRYGKGRTQRKLRLRKGSIIHRSKIEKMPTGFET